MDLAPEELLPVPPLVAAWPSAGGATTAATASGAATAAFARNKFGHEFRELPRMNATEVTEFFLKFGQNPVSGSPGSAALPRRGRCFEGWTADKVFNYVLVNLVDGNVFVAAAAGLPTQPRSGIGLAAIAWPGDAATIIANAERGLPQYDWTGFPVCTGVTNGSSIPLCGTASLDSILVADVAGDRKLMPEILAQVVAPRAIFEKRIFTYRRGGSATGLRLVELSWKTVLRFSNQK